MVSKPKIVITGGLGFIFSHVTEFFVQKGWKVVVIDNLSEGSHPEIIDGSFKHINMHMANPDVISTILEERPDYLIHAAAITDVDYSIREPYRTLRKNLLGILHAFEASRSLPDLQKFMYVSTDEVYGECEHSMKENDTLLPKNPYSCSKALGSLAHVAYRNTFPVMGAKIVETRMCNIFGPRQDTRKIMPQIKESLKGTHSISLHQGGSGFRQYLYVKNIPSAVDLILEKGEGVYNITADEGLTVKDLIAKAEQITGKKVSTHEGSRPGMDMKYLTDGERIFRLGWRPTYSLDEGLAEYFLG
jgi:nucleoside-diphosphate-sugar epimerase